MQIFVATIDDISTGQLYVEVAQVEDKLKRLVVTKLHAINQDSIDDIFCGNEATVNKLRHSDADDLDFSFSWKDLNSALFDIHISIFVKII